MALLGILLISSGSGEAFHLNPLGDLLAAGAAVVWAAYSTITKKISEFGCNTIQTTRRTFFYGLIFMIPAIMLMDFQIDLSQFIDLKNILYLLFLGFGASAFCFDTWNFAVKVLGSVRTSVYIYMVPVITAAASWLILQMCIRDSHSDMLYIGWNDFFTSRKEFKRTMENQNNNGNYDNRNRRKFKKKKRIYHKSVCIVLCLLIAIAGLGIVNLIRSGKEAPIPEKKVTQNNESFSFGDSGQKETVSPILDTDNALSVNVTAANAIVINADTNATMYQKNGTDKISPASTAKMITALTVLDYCSPDDEIRAGAEIEMIHDDSSRAWLMKGDTLTVRQDVYKRQVWWFIRFVCLSLILVVIPPMCCS